MIMSASPTPSWTNSSSLGQIFALLVTILGNILLNTIEQVRFAGKNTGCATLGVSTDGDQQFYRSIMA
jgi:hypothetical protein